MDNTNTYSAKFKTIQLIYLAFILAVLVFTIVIIFLAEKPKYFTDMNDIFIYIVPVLSITGIFMSEYLFKTNLSSITSKDDLSSKLGKYTTATLIKGSLLEAPALLAAIVSHLSNDFIYLIFTAVLLLMMYLRFPKPSKFEGEVQLTMDEKSQFRRG